MCRWKVSGSQVFKTKPLEENWSELRFPNKDLSTGDFKLWEEALGQIAPRGRVVRRLGKFVSKPHKIWEWRMCVETEKLLRLGGHKMTVFERSQMRGHRGPNKYVSTNQEVPVENGSHYCTVEEATPGVWRVKTKSEVERDKGEPLDFL